MTRLKLVAAAAVLSTMMVAPGNGTAYHRGHDGYRDRGPVDAAAGIAGAVVGTAAAIATAPATRFHTATIMATAMITAMPGAMASSVSREPGSVAKTVAGTSASRPHRNQRRPERAAFPHRS